MKRHSRWLAGMVFFCMMVMAAPLRAHSKLVVLPDPGTALIRLDNPRATLVEEERVVTLQKGRNQVVFSWNGVRIDPDSIRLSPLSHPEKVTLLNVSYPPGESALIWEISSAEDWEEKIRVSYLLADLDWLVTHTVLTDVQEKQMHLKSHLILRNFSGEDFHQARILSNFGKTFEQSILNEETKQMLFYMSARASFRKIWRFDARIHSWDPETGPSPPGIPVFYRISNSEDSGMGKLVLSKGKVRVFQEDTQGSTIFLGEDRMDTVTVGNRTDIHIGDSRDVLVTQRQMTDRMINIRRNKKNTVILYDTDEVIEARIENFKDQPVDLTMVQYIPGQWKIISCNMPHTIVDASTLEFEIALTPRSEKILTLHYHRMNVR